MKLDINKDPASVLAAKYASFIKGKAILTTGVTPGSIGAEFVKAIAPYAPALLIIAGRTPAKLQTLSAALKEANPGVATRELQLDLSSLEGPKKAASIVNAWDDVKSIDIVVNSAGVMATPYSESPEGIESQFMLNHLAHFLFTNLIMSKILAAPEPRIISITSDGHRLGDINWDDINYNSGKDYQRFSAYGQAKTANILFTRQLAAKLGEKGAYAFSVHPGLIPSSGLGAHFDDIGGAIGEFMAMDREMGHEIGFLTEEDFGQITLTPEQGAATYVVAAFDQDIKQHNGAHLADCEIVTKESDNGMLKDYAVDPVSAERLWKLSEKLVGQSFDM